MNGELRGDRRRTGRNHPHRHAARLYHQRQAGINYHRNVWHHPLFAYAKVTDFFTIDRAGADNCVVSRLPEPYRIVLA